ncbi:fibronectin type 3 domain-containing protein [Silvibacterium bohemicum]|uniref:Fibronectin type 3 domain-containing protein n=1 Tax=Silvibacterium bohemicum TaxID=1577686 RepID=A0A841JSM1_9BACT|nr:malectin domain-containing carbohydrate-binding protein [Silvibacterium bohemicum]MBB6143455.1 fibronectin type 3 domain-containing protein [Silvibacterium bohemicum]
MNQQIPNRYRTGRANAAISQAQNDLVISDHRVRNAFFLLAAICLFWPHALHAQWTQVWGGPFTGSANTTYNHSEWWNNVEDNTGNQWGDGTIQSTSDSLQNVYLDGNGNLVIAMTYNASPGAGQSAYTSARLTSTYAAGPYGRVDARIQNPSATGMGAAFWALGANAYPAGTGPGSANPSNNGGVPWPWCGELDMMEIQSVTSQHNGSTVHGGETDSQTSYEYGGLSATVNLTGSATFDNGFHIFSTQWEPYQLEYFLDGTAYGTVNLADLGATDQWEMNQPINFILSSGVGGNGGTPTGTGFPSNMLVNYVNYSTWSAGPPSPVSALTATATYSNAVTLSWDASPTTGVTYDIYGSTTPNTPPGIGTLVAQQVTGTSYTQTGLQPNTPYYYTVVSANYGGESTATNVSVTTPAPGNSTGMQLSAGGYAVGTYMNSGFVLGGNSNYHYHVAINTAQVTNPAPQQGYDSERWGPAAWTITGLNPKAGYNVRLHFVENAHTAAGQRNFNVSINSDTVLNNFDIFSAAGAASTAVAEEFYTQADENGIIEIQTNLGTSTVADLNPTINAIEIIPATGSDPVGAAPGTATALSINSGGGAASNSGGGDNSFIADEDFNGGDTSTTTNVVSTAGVANAAPEAVYQSQRYVPFTYILTGLTADATYTVRMHFAETYWTAAGQRLFNVVINGNQVITKLDLFATVGANKALVEQFPANADMYGQIIVQLVYDGADQPEINGIEALLASSAIGTPGNLTATPSGGSIALSWSASSTSGVTYSVYRGASGTAPALLTSGLSTTTYTDSTVTNGTTYVYYVVAVKGSGLSSQSNWATATAGASGSCGAVPSAPGGLTAAASSASAIALSWSGVTAPANCTISSYKVYSSTTSGFTPSSGNLITSTTATSYTNSGLSAGTTYYYKVEAADGDGSSLPSAQASATTHAGSSSGAEIVAIAAGAPAESNATGGDYPFVADEDFSGGGDNSATTATINLTEPGPNAAPMAVYQHGRAGVFTYTIPGLTAGTQYTVLLHFAETYWTAAGDRVFNVSINGTTVLSNFDIYANVGANAALVEAFTATANSSGDLVIAFTRGTSDQPLLSGLEIR